MTNNNTTGRSSLDRLGRDPRIEEIWDEGGNGYWASLRPGYNAEGCSAIHGWTVRELLAMAKLIEVGESS